MTVVAHPIPALYFWARPAMPMQEIGTVRLSSWKAIAAYLGKDVRTAIRWERTRGLPVCRPPGEGRSSVYALTTEIDSWLNEQPRRNPPPDGEDRLGGKSVPTQSAQAISLPPADARRSSPRRYWIAAGVVLAASFIGALAYHHLRALAASPTRATFTTDSIQAWDDHDHLLWEHRFNRLLAPWSRESNMLQSPDTKNRSLIVDLTGDGQREVLAVAVYPRADSSDDVGEQVLYCFGSTGKLLWSDEPKTVLTLGTKRYEAPWVPKQIVVSDEPGAKTIWVNEVDPVWGKSFIARLDRSGHSSIQFVNSGEIATMQRIHTARGPMLWIAGFNDEYDTASLAIMRDTQEFASSPQTPGTHFACRECRPGEPLAYLVFPRYDVSTAAHNPNNKIFSITSTANVVELHQKEISDDDQIIYDFDKSDFNQPLRVAYSSSFWPNHSRLESDGFLNHKLANCPDRLHPPPVRRYQDGEWKEIAVTTSPRD